MINRLFSIAAINPRLVILLGVVLLADRKSTRLNSSH